MNIEVDQETLGELDTAFRFNDAVIRNLTIQRKEAVTTPSPLAKSSKEEGESPRYSESRTARETGPNESAPEETVGADA